MIGGKEREKRRKANGFQKRNQVRRLTDAPDFSVCPDRA
jgi:hypothetical protein